jgi:hypothetical protein
MHSFVTMLTVAPLMVVTLNMTGSSPGSFIAGFRSYGRDADVVVGNSKRWNRSQAVLV